MNRYLLLIEDEELHIKLFTRNILRVNSDYTVIVARDGLDALNHIESHYEDIDTILLDLNLPQLDGLRLLERIRQNPKLAGLRVVIITSSDDVEDIGKAQTFGVAGYIVKPVSFDQLREVLG